MCVHCIDTGGNRRYYLIDSEHDGCNSGPKTAEFSELAKNIHEQLKDDRAIAALYKALMERRQANDFNAKSLNLGLHATPLMKRIEGVSVNTVAKLLEEHLQAQGLHAMTDQDVAEYIARELRQKVTTSKHLMAGELGWTLHNVKWGGCDYRRHLWVQEGYSVDRGTLIGPDGSRQNLADYLAAKTYELL